MYSLIVFMTITSSILFFFHGFRSIAFLSFGEAKVCAFMGSNLILIIAMQLLWSGDENFFVSLFALNPDLFVDIASTANKSFIIALISFFAIYYALKKKIVLLSK